MSDFNPNLIRQHMANTEVLAFGIDYYTCEDARRTEAEAAELAYTFALKYCRKWYKRDRNDPETRHARAFDAFSAQVQQKRYFYSKRRRELDEAEAKTAEAAKNEAAREEEHKKQLENERKRITALRERCIAKGLDFEKANIRQLKRRYVAQKIAVAIETCCTGMLFLSIVSCGYGDGSWESVLLCIGLFMLAVLIHLLFCRPGKRLPKEAFDPILKKKKKQDSTLT